MQVKSLLNAQKNGKLSKPRCLLSPYLINRHIETILREQVGQSGFVGGYYNNHVQVDETLL